VRTKQQSAFTLVEMLVVIAIIGLLIAITMPALNAAREASRTTQCTINLRQIGIALHNYHAQHKSFPINYATLADTGNDETHPCQRFPDTVIGLNTPGRSWMYGILPFIDEMELYQEANNGQHLDWEDPATGRKPNMEVAETVLKLFICPSDRGDRSEPSRRS